MLISNLVSRSFFLVSDLKGLVNQIEKLEFKVNQGPQSKRGQSSSINNTIHCFDLDFRNSMLRHNKYFHKNNQGIEVIYSDKFSYSNIHINLGVRNI